MSWRIVKEIMEVEDNYLGVLVLVLLCLGGLNVSTLTRLNY